MRLIGELLELQSLKFEQLINVIIERVCRSVYGFELVSKMASADNSFKIEKLTAENYHSWKFNIKMSLIGKDL